MSTSQRGAQLGCRLRGEASQRSSHLPRSCQHKILGGMLKKWEQFGTVQASYGCLVDHVCIGVRISVFEPYLCNTLISVLDEYVDGCRIQKGADWYPFCLGGGTGRGVWGGDPSGVYTTKSKVPSKKRSWWQEQKS